MTDHLLIAFGLRVKALRLKRNLTQVQLADKGGFDRNYIGMIERGERNPSLINLQRLADSLEVELSILMKFNHNNK